MDYVWWVATGSLATTCLVLVGCNFKLQGLLDTYRAEYRRLDSRFLKLLGTHGRLWAMRRAAQALVPDWSRYARRYREVFKRMAESRNLDWKTLRVRDYNRVAVGATGRDGYAGPATAPARTDTVRGPVPGL